MEQWIDYAPLIAGLIVGFALVAGYKHVLRLVFGMVIVPETHVALVNKKFVVVGANRTLPPGAIIALNGEAGWQADALAPGLYWSLWPWQYEIEIEPFVTVAEGHLGVVEAVDGAPLTRGRVLARTPPCDSFQNARAFLTSGGERGPQMAIIPPGTYRINTRLFTVDNKVEALDIPDNKVGIVTTREGAALATGDIAGREIAGHNSFQDPERFVNGGGTKGLQEQVILAGRYFINPLFAEVESVDMTLVPAAHVGVVIAYVGDPGVDVTGDDFKHGNLVARGQKGFWVEPLDPGKYAINPYTHKVELVPTANVVLNWANNKSEAHKLDANLCTITARSSDGFTYNLDVSQIIHVPRKEAPKVISRFGNMPNLVTQVLEPTIGNYFRNAAQESDAIDFLRTRKERQAAAKLQIAGALKDYDITAVDTLIGDIVPPEALMKTLADKKIAEKQRETFAAQKISQDARRELEESTAMAATQAGVVAADRQIVIATHTANAAVEKAKGSAAAKKLEAEADAAVLTMVGEATAKKTLAVGNAEASVIEQKIKSMEAGNYAGIEIANALATATQPLVPAVSATGADGGGNPLMTLLLASLVKKEAA